ncbi:hypothetical protein BDC45DRAFT_532368 [Circinella umbellata]|nr:hypothetical protein BDC45DRAFT_532368 [Circinella umbellata]
MNPTTITNNSTSRFCSDCKCIRSIELFCGKRDFYKTCITCRNKNSDVGKAIPAELLITTSEAIELIPSRYDDDEDMEMDGNRVVTRDDRSISYSVDAYISFDDSMRAMDDQELLTHIRTRVQEREHHLITLTSAIDHFKRKRIDLIGSTIVERYNAAEKRIIAANDFFLKKNLNLDELKRRWEVRLHEMENGRYIPEDPNLTLAKITMQH